MPANWDRRGLDEQRRVQDLTTGRWIRAAASYSRYWGEHLRTAGIDPAAVDGVGGLTAIPTVRELDVRDVGGPGSPALVMRPSEEDLKSTGDLGDLLAIARRIRGSTDDKRHAILRDWKPIHVAASGRDGLLALAYSRSDLDRLHRVGARTASVLGLTDRDYLVSAVAAGPTPAFWALRHLALGASILATHTRGAGQGPEAALEGFSLVPVTAVAVPLDEAVPFAELVGESGVDASRVATVLTLGPPPSDERRREVSEVWRGATVAALWGPNGSRHLWAECAEGARGGTAPGLHLHPDLEYVELVDPVDGRPTDRGGDLTLTSIGWHGTALIRLESGDFAGDITTEPCPACGRTVPRVVGPVVPGAWEPLLADGQRLDLRGIAAVLREDGDVNAWRVELRRVRKRDGYVVHVATDLSEGALADLGRRIGEAAGVAPSDVTVTPRNEIEERNADVGSVFEDSR